MLSASLAPRHFHADSRTVLGCDIARNAWEAPRRAVSLLLHDMFLGSQPLMTHTPAPKRAVR